MPPKFVLLLLFKRARNDPDKLPCFRRNASTVSALWTLTKILTVPCKSLNVWLNEICGSGAISWLNATNVATEGASIKTSGVRGVIVVVGVEGVVGVVGGGTLSPELTSEPPVLVSVGVATTTVSNKSAGGGGTITMAGGEDGSNDCVFCWGVGVVLVGGFVVLVGSVETVFVFPVLVFIAPLFI